MLLAQTRLPDDQFRPGAIRDDQTTTSGLGRLRLLQVKPAGGKLISFDAFAHGRRLALGDRWLPLDEAT